MKRDEEKRLIWKNPKGKNFLVKDFYSCLELLVVEKSLILYLGSSVGVNFDNGLVKKKMTEVG